MLTTSSPSGDPSNPASPKKPRRELVSIRRLKKLFREIENLEAQQRKLFQSEHIEAGEKLQFVIDDLRDRALRTRGKDRDLVIAAIGIGCLTVDDIQAEANLTRHTIKLMLHDMRREGLIERVPELRSMPGRPRYLYRINKNV